MYQIGIMQGRLTSSRDDRIQFFPRDSWSEEFKLAAMIGFNCIEWLYDLHDADINPLSTNSGIEKVKSLMQQTGVQVKSLCAHCFIESPLIGASDEKLKELLIKLDWLMQRTKQFGITRIVLPLEDASHKFEQVEYKRQMSWIRQALIIAENMDIELDLETTLSPSSLGSFLNDVQHHLLKVNYDIGNSAGLGYRMEEEFAAYGHRIGSVHIKDKLLNGPTVAIGTGIANFKALSRLLHKINFKGDVILEAARGAPGDEVEWAKRNLNFVLQYLGS